MLATNISHALGSHMHQPPGNLALLLEANAWEAERIIRCYERPTRYARRYAGLAQLHIVFSGILLEQLLEQDIIDRYRHIVDIAAMLDAYRSTPNTELIGMGYLHQVLQAQTSCFLFWGEDSLPRLAALPDAAEARIAASAASGAAASTVAEGATEKRPGSRR
jgi:hypothetical protein